MRVVLRLSPPDILGVGSQVRAFARSRRPQAPPAARRARHAARESSRRPARRRTRNAGIATNVSGSSALTSNTNRRSTTADRNRAGKPGRETHGNQPATFARAPAAHVGRARAERHADADLARPVADRVRQSRRRDRPPPARAPGPRGRPPRSRRPGDGRIQSRSSASSGVAANVSLRSSARARWRSAASRGAADRRPCARAGGRRADRTPGRAAGTATSPCRATARHDASRTTPTIVSGTGNPSTPS